MAESSGLSSRGLKMNSQVLSLQLGLLALPSRGWASPSCFLDFLKKHRRFPITPLVRPSLVNWRQVRQEALCLHLTANGHFQGNAHLNPNSRCPPLRASSRSGRPQHTLASFSPPPGAPNHGVNLGLAHPRAGTVVGTVGLTSNTSRTWLPVTSSEGLSHPLPLVMPSPLPGLTCHALREPHPPPASAPDGSLPTFCHQLPGDWGALCRAHSRSRGPGSHTAGPANMVDAHVKVFWFQTLASAVQLLAPGAGDGAQPSGHPRHPHSLPWGPRMAPGAGRSHSEPRVPGIDGI